MNTTPRHQDFSPQTAREALVIAQSYANDTERFEREVLSHPQYVPVATAIRRGTTQLQHFTMRDRGQAIQDLGQDIYEHISLCVLTAATVRLWKKAMVVYRVHPGLVRALIHVATDQEVPCEVFQRLPHADPFIAFPEPIVIERVATKFEVTEQPVFTGMLVTGMTKDGLLCSTADPRLRWLNIALVGPVHYAGGQSGYEERTLRVPVTGTSTVEEMIRTFRAQTLQPGDPDPGDWQPFSLAVNLLLYVCSATRDLQPAQAKTKHRRGKTRASNGPARTAEVLDLGFDIGPRLFAADAPSPGSAPSDDAASDRPATRTVRSHLRRAHYQSYWVGPRAAATRELRFIFPTVVNSGVSSGRPMVIDADPGLNE